MTALVGTDVITPPRAAWLNAVIDAATAAAVAAATASIQRSLGYRILHAQQSTDLVAAGIATLDHGQLNANQVPEDLGAAQSPAALPTDDALKLLIARLAAAGLDRELGDDLLLHAKDYL